MASTRATLRTTIAALSGAALAASFPPGPAWLAWVALAPLVALLRAASGPREALRLGWAAGAGLCAWGLGWMVGTLQVFAELGLWAVLPLFALFCAWTGAPLAIWALVMSQGTWSSRHALWVAPLALPGIWSLWPAVFPFSPAVGLAGRPAWIQAAELGGAPLVEALVVLCAVLLAEAWRAGSRRGRAGWAALAAALPLLAGVVGEVRIASLEGETRRVVQVGLVQPNIPVLWSDKQARLARLREASAAAEAAGAELVVWPENIYPWTVDRPWLRDFEDDDRILARHRLPTLLGAGSAADEDAFGYNSAFFMDAAGEIRGRFDKVLLVPLGEEVPLVDPLWAKSLTPGIAHNFAGAGPTRFEVVPGPRGSAGAPVTLGPLICYEDIFAWFARAVAGQPGGIEAFVNLTNDTWFGATDQPWQHLGLAQLRSVEHRIPSVRAVNSGPSSIVDRAGRVSATTEVREATTEAAAEHLVAPLEIGRDTAFAPTIFARGGWLFVHVCQAAAAAAGLAALRRRGRARA